MIKPTELVQQRAHELQHKHPINNTACLQKLGLELVEDKQKLPCYEERYDSSHPPLATFVK